MGKIINFRRVSTSALPNGAALITHEGKEIAITEHMVESACKRLENDSFQLGAFLFNQANQSHVTHLQLV